jgi:hypothetical protein
MSDLSPQIIISRMVERYGTCSSCVDHGSLLLRSVTLLDGKLESYEWAASYSLKFNRDGDTNFTFQQSNAGIGEVSRFVLDLNTAGATLLLSGPAAQPRQLSIKDAVVITTGLSYGVTTLLFQLLLPHECISCMQIAVPTWSKGFTNANSWILTRGAASDELESIGVRKHDYGVVSYATRYGGKSYGLRFAASTSFQPSRRDQKISTAQPLSFEFDVSLDPSFG